MCVVWHCKWSLYLFIAPHKFRVKRHFRSARSCDYTPKSPITYLAVRCLSILWPVTLKPHAHFLVYTFYINYDQTTTPERAEPEALHGCFFHKLLITHKQMTEGQTDWLSVWLGLWYNWFTTLVPYFKMKPTWNPCFCIHNLDFHFISFYFEWLKLLSSG